MESITLRRFTDGDSVEELTRLLHRAYADHAAAGLVFFASYQTPEDTRRRLGKGECWIALEQGAIVGSVTVTGTYDTPPGYPAPTAAGSFWQLAVAPSRRGTGLGSRLLTLAETRIADLGSSRVMIDTSSQAADLLAWYGRHGYSSIGTWKWDVTNYDSVVLAKSLLP
ncbi:GNAT family N-acetyltransferase [Streptosporangium sp. NPDC049376]|uniref:GNAT family N-acetyltransferase n=1 Tax=Streptosporangium sp. NPDC049376 TaxID=3366192 RepID=UPI00378D202C